MNKKLQHMFGASIRRNFTPSFTYGVTLVELLIVLSILVITASIAVPGFSNLLGNQRVSSTTNTLARHIKLAQSEAIRSSRPAVTICVAAVRATPACDSGSNANWNQGWFVWRDSDGDDVIDIDTELIAEEGANANLHIPGPPNSITFNAIGAPTGGNEIKLEVSNGTGSTGAKSEVINVLLSGQLYTRIATQ